MVVAMYLEEDGDKIVTKLSRTPAQQPSARERMRATAVRRTGRSQKFGGSRQK
jgi:hypothetical protein